MCHLDDVTRIKPVYTFLDSICPYHIWYSLLMQVGVMPFRSNMCVWHTMGDAGDDTDGGPLHHGVDDYTTVLRLHDVVGDCMTVSSQIQLCLLVHDMKSHHEC